MSETTHKKPADLEVGDVVVHGNRKVRITEKPAPGKYSVYHGKAVPLDPSFNVSWDYNALVTVVAAVSVGGGGEAK